MRRKYTSSGEAKEPKTLSSTEGNYSSLISGIGSLLEQARRTAARAINSVLTATYWEIGRRIVEYEQGGNARAEYGEALLVSLARDLTAHHGRGFSKSNLFQMRALYSGWDIFQTPSGKSEARVICAPPSSSARAANCPTVSAESIPESTSAVIGAFPLSWSHYVRLMSVGNPHARAFYEAEAIRGGWSVRQLDRQVATQFFERASASSDPERLLVRAQRPKETDRLTAEEEVRDPYVLEFLGLKDEYSESELEDALIQHLEQFLLELGTGFTFVARQKRIRIGDSWFRIDLVLFHRGLRCLVLVDLKTGAFTHADAGQMNLYLNYAREHMKLPDEVDPIGIILCTEKDHSVVKYATSGIPMRVFASNYLTSLPDEETLRREIERTQRVLRGRRRGRRARPRSAIEPEAGPGV